MKSLLTLLIIVCCTIGSLQAQHTETDVVYLENGSVLKGKILYEDEETLKLEMYDGSIWAFQQADIIKKESEPYSLRLTRRKNFPTVFKTKGYMHYSAFGFSLTEDTWGGYTSGFNMEVINGYRFFPQLYTALHIGVNQYPDMSRTFFPFALRVGGDVLNKKVTPTYYAGVGYSTPAKGYEDEWETYQGGVYTDVGVGLKVNSKSNIGYIMHVGYRFHKYTETESFDEFNSFETERNIKRLTFTFGFVY